MKRRNIRWIRSIATGATRLVALAAIAVACVGAPGNGNGDGDASIAKYGQVFKGKIAESYADSEERWPSTPEPPAGTPVSNKYRVTNHYPYDGELDKVIFRPTD